MGETALVVDLALEYGPGVIGGIGGAVNTLADYRSQQSVDPNAPAPGFGQYASSIAFGAASGYYAEERLLTAGTISAAGSAVQDLQNGQTPSLSKAALSFIAPAIGKKGYRALVGPSPLEELQAGISDASRLSVLNVPAVTAQQLRYMTGGGTFGIGIDTVKSGLFSSSGSRSGTSGGGGGGSSGLIGLYQSLVSTLSAIVSVLSSGKR